jgi:hypothetical protein
MLEYRRWSRASIKGRENVNYKLGKQKPKIDARTLQLGKYLLPTLPPPPAAQDYGKAVTAAAGRQTPPWPMYDNDKLGDCTCAAAGHMIEVWTANSSTLVEIPDTAVVDAYRHFNPGTQDNGCNMLDVLKYWRSTGFGQRKIHAFVGIEPKNHNQAKDALDLFGTIYIGAALPDFVVPSDGTNWLTIPWVVPATGPIGNAAPNPNNGHCIPAVAYDDRNLYIVTWGALKSMSWSFYDAYADEAYAVLSPDWFAKTGGNAPNGFNLTTLNQDLSALSGVKTDGAKVPAGVA